MDHKTEYGTPVITEMKVIPVAGYDSMLMTLSGAHAPYFTRNLVILKDSAGHTGIGEIHGGQRFNIIANKVVMEGTTRTHSAEMRGKTEGLLRNIVEHVAASFGAKATLKFDYFPGPVVNDHEDLNRIANAAAVKMYGEGCLKSLPKMMGSEDFAMFMEKVPGVFGFIGSRNEALGYTAKNHNDHYTVDESVLKQGAAMYAQFAWDYLEEKAE